MAFMWKLLNESPTRLVGSESSEHEPEFVRLRHNSAKRALRPLRHLFVSCPVHNQSVDPDAALVQMFGQVQANNCKYVLAVGALADLTDSTLPYESVDHDAALVQMFGQVQANNCKYVLAVGALAVPYESVDPDAALVEMFGQVQAYKCKYVLAVGALAGLTVSMFGSMFPMPRIVYAMAQDGLIFRTLSTVLPATGTPVIATFSSGLAAAVAALVIRLEVLVEMMSIGKSTFANQLDFLC
ncbi:hypothetical protein J6590_011816 [Homalodisca vitripennis]|nr:hypothetical protein J6590_011816 [Homalodisca vitripennis]